MSSRLFITIRTIESNREIDLEIPSDLKVQEVLVDISKSLFNYQISNNNLEKLVLMTEEGTVLPSDATLSQFSIQNFDILKLGFSDAYANLNLVQKNGENVNCSEPEPTFFQELEPKVDDISVEPALVCNSRYAYVLSNKEMIVGRKSKEITPDIDISDLDLDYVASRKHALIIPRGGKHYCKPFLTRNGTYLNGKQLEPENEILLNKGDIIQLGFRGIELEYQTPD